MATKNRCNIQLNIINWKQKVRNFKEKTIIEPHTLQYRIFLENVCVSWASSIVLQFHTIFIRHPFKKKKKTLQLNGLTFLDNTLFSSCMLQVSSNLSSLILMALKNNGVRWIIMALTVKQFSSFLLCVCPTIPHTRELMFQKSSELPIVLKLYTFWAHCGPGEFPSTIDERITARVVTLWRSLCPVQYWYCYVVIITKNSEKPLPETNSKPVPKCNIVFI